MKNLQQLLEKPAGILLRRLHYEKYVKASVKEDMKELVPPLQLEKQLFSYYSKKLAITFLILIGGGLLTLLLFVKEEQGGEIVMAEEGAYVERGSYKEADKEVTVVAGLEEEQSRMKLTVESAKYTREEFYLICQEIEEALPFSIKGENEDLEHINTDLNLIEKYEDYPLTITWNCNDYTYIHTDGTLNMEALGNLQDSALACLTAVISYDIYEESISFPVRFIKPTESEEDSVWERLQCFLEEEQSETRTEKKFLLPKEFEGKALSFREQKDRASILVFFLTIIAGILLFFAGNQDLHKKTEKRREQLLGEYPEFVSKLMLYMGAGMTSKAAFGQLCSDYGRTAKRFPKKEHYLYEELKYMMHSMENGVFEVDAYEEFGRRCRVSQYRKLMAILTQNAKKGTSDLLRQLEDEAKETFVQKKNEARRLGEKAGTKLLLPMILMLGIVMVIVIVPAFLSYQI